MHCVLGTAYWVVRREWGVGQNSTAGIGRADDIHEPVADFSVVSIDSRPKRLKYLRDVFRGQVANANADG